MRRWLLEIIFNGVSEEAQIHLSHESHPILIRPGEMKMVKYHTSLVTCKGTALPPPHRKHQSREDMIPGHRAYWFIHWVWALTTLIVVQMTKSRQEDPGRSINTGVSLPPLFFFTNNTEKVAQHIIGWGRIVGLALGAYWTCSVGV